MDDVPSRPVERTTTEPEATGRDFYDLATDFTVLHREIAKGVLDAVGRRCTKDDFQTVRVGRGTAREKSSLFSFLHI